FGNELEERPRRHLGIARRALRQIADAAFGSHGLRFDVVPANEHAARRGGQEAGDDAHRRGLARAVRTQEAEHLAGLDPEAQVVYGAEPPILFGEALDIDHLEIRRRPIETEVPRRGASFSIDAKSVSSYRLFMENSMGCRL